MAAAWWLAGGTAQAADEMTIVDFNSDLTLTNSDPQGHLHIVETISVDFAVPRHGILRAIPSTYQKQPLQLAITSVSSPSGAPSGYTKETSNGNTVLKIGDASQTVTGRQSYVIDYTVRNVVRWFDGRPQLYWDINGDQWDSETQHVTATIHLSGSTFGESLCFTGAYGSSAQNCTVHSENDMVSASTTTSLAAYQTLTVAAKLPEGVFVAPTWRDWLREHAVELGLAILIPLLAGGWSVRKWWRDGRDLKGRGVIVPEYGPPTGVTPAEAGVIDGYRLESRDLTATLVDLAIRKYVRIIEVEKKGFLSSGNQYQFELLKTDWSTLNELEQDLLGALFENKTAGSVLEDIKDRRTELAALRLKLTSSLPKSLTERGFFPANPVTSGGWLWAVGIALGVGAFMLANLSALVATTCGVTAVAVFALAVLMPKRTGSGVAAWEQIQGLKLYLNTAEKDRLNLLQSVSRKYNRPLAEAPQRTVELFEKLLPYAIVLGVEDSWAQQFTDIYTAEPDWYSGHWTTFNALSLSHSLNGAVGAINTSFSPPSSSSGSGFGGGGFSGGGGGGGGGGSW